MTIVSDTMANESRPSSALLRDSSLQWAEALHQTSNELEDATAHIQKTFRSASERSQYQDQDSIPDLVDIMRRIRKLEATVENLQRNSSGIIEEETTVLSAAFDQINANQALLSQLLQEAQVVDTEPLEVRQEREALQKKLDLMLPRSK